MRYKSVWENPTEKYKSTYQERGIGLKMKNGLSAIMVCVLAVLLAGCGSSETENRGNSAAANENMSVQTDVTEGTDSEAAQDGTARPETAEPESGEAAAADNVFASEEIVVSTEHTEDNTMKITAGDTTFTATLADNSSVEALKELLAEGPLTINMSDYAGMEKVGPIGTSLPRNDEQISTGAGDIILYQGNSLVIYYDTNSWNFTRIGKIEGVTGEELLDAFGSGDVTVTFSLE